MQMQLIESFKRRVRTALETHEVSARKFGDDAMGDPSFVRRLFAGTAPTIKTIERVEAFIAKLDRQKAERKRGKAA
jgi:hypothetical protein